MVLSGLFTLSFVMILGRIVPVLVLWWTAEDDGDRHRCRLRCATF